MVTVFLEEEIWVHSVFLILYTRIICADISPFGKQTNKQKTLLRPIFSYQGSQCHIVLGSYTYRSITIKCFNFTPSELWQNHCSIHYSDNHQVFAIVVITIKLLTKWKWLIHSLLWELLLIAAYIHQVSWRSDLFYF